MGQEHICGLVIETSECSKIQIKAVPLIDTHIRILDWFVEYFDSVTNPKIDVSMFAAKENSQLAVVIQPVTIGDEPNHVKYSQQFLIHLYCNNTDKQKAYSSILLLLRLFYNFMEVLIRREGLTYVANFSITNIGEATISLTLSKQFDALTAT